MINKALMIQWRKGKAYEMHSAVRQQMLLAKMHKKHPMIDHKMVERVEDNLEGED